MLELIAVTGIIYVSVITCMKRLALSHSITIVAIIGSLAFFTHSITTEFRRANQVTFYNAELQLTTGVYCIDHTVMFKVKDSIRKVDYPLQVLNENTFKGKLDTRLHCDDGVFLDEHGKAVARDDVLRIVIKNIITGYLPYTSTNTVKLAP